MSAAIPSFSLGLREAPGNAEALGGTGESMVAMFFGVFTHILWEIAKFFVVLDILLEGCQCGVPIETPDIRGPEVVS